MKVKKYILPFVGYRIQFIRLQRVLEHNLITIKKCLEIYFLKNTYST